MAADQRIYISLPFMLIFAGFAGAHIIDLVMTQGDLTTMLSGAKLLQLVIGIVGLVGGNILYDELIVQDYERQSEDIENVEKGILLFAVMTIFMSVLSSFSVYKAQLKSSVFDHPLGWQFGFTVLLGAGPFEESFFAFFVAPMVFAAMLEIIPTMRVIFSHIFSTILGIFGIDSTPTSVADKTDTLNRMLAMVAAAAIVAVFFVWLHAAVANIADPNVFQFYFLNRFGYTLFFLWTGSVLGTTISHMLHNGVVIFL